MSQGREITRTFTDLIIKSTVFLIKIKFKACHMSGTIQGTLHLFHLILTTTNHYAHFSLFGSK